MGEAEPPRFLVHAERGPLTASDAGVALERSRQLVLGGEVTQPDHERMAEHVGIADDGSAGLLYALGSARERLGGRSATAGGGRQPDVRASVMGL